MVSKGEGRCGGVGSAVRAALITLVIAATVGLSACSSATTEVRTEPVVTLSAAERDARVQGDLDGIRGGVQAYYNRYQRLPDSLLDLRDTPDSQPLIEDVPRDPWRTPYMLRRLDQDVLLWTSGPDLIIGTTDDIEMRVSFDGVAPQPVSAGEASP
jgi:hypothetical protein